MKTNSTEKIRRIGNTILAKYSFHNMSAQMYDRLYSELNEAGIAVGMILGGEKKTVWFYNDQEIDDSCFVVGDGFAYFS